MIIPRQTPCVNFRFRERFNALLAERILVLDGAMGSMVMAFRTPAGKALDEGDFRGERFRCHEKPLWGCNDVLCLTQPEVIAGIHEAYLASGADIIETCSLNASSVGLEEFGLSPFAFEISRASAMLARKLADDFSIAGKPRFVAGSVGPTAKSAAITQDIDNPGKRQISWDELEASYYENIRGLVEGGADFLLIETVYDGLNAKAALSALNRLCLERGEDIPAMVSATVSEGGRLLTGQNPEAFCVSMLHSDPLALGLNCSFGTEKLTVSLEKVSALVSCPVIFYPNAGFPDQKGCYSDTPEIMARAAEICMKDGLVNIIGGCCGSTPAHIAAIAEKARCYKPRFIPGQSPAVLLAGTEVFEFPGNPRPAGLVPWQGEIDSGNYEEAIEIARDEISRKGSEILLIYPDKAPDPENTARNFLFLAASFSELAKCPVLIVSSSWNVIEAGLKCVQGRGLAQYIAPQEAADFPGEYEKKMKLIRSYGALPFSH